MDRASNAVSASGSQPYNDPTMIKLRQRLAFLCHDLQCFSSNDAGAERLSSSVHPYLIGPPCVSVEGTGLLLSCDLATVRGPTSDSGGGKQALTLAQFLAKGMADVVAARRARGEREPGAGGGDFVMCTLHDLAPLLLEACGFSKQRFETCAFKDAYKRWEKDARKAENKKGQKRGGAGGGA